MTKTISQLVKDSHKSVFQLLNGYCYVFAKELQKATGGEVVYLLQEQHVVVKVGEKIYDATGNVTSKYKNSDFLTEEELKKRNKIYNSLKVVY